LEPKRSKKLVDGKEKEEEETSGRGPFLYTSWGMGLRLRDSARARPE
jgi:hypothetical protein